MDVEEDSEEERIRLEQEAIAKKKAHDKKLKDINKNFNRKDKKETHKFLTKHGLTSDEAKDYTQLGTEFDVKLLDPEDKKILDGNFLAQVYAFRKLRDRLLLTDNPASIYNTIDMSTRSPEKQGQLRNTSQIQQIKAKFKSLRKAGDQDQINAMVESTQKEMTEAQVKLIRRREYYNRRVKQDFAPKVIATSKKSANGSDDNDSQASESPKRKQK